MLEKKINLKNELRMISELAFRVVIITAILYFIHSFVADLPLWLSVVIILAVSLPTVYLHLTYAYRDKNKVLYIEEAGHIILKENDNRFNLSSSNKITIKGSVALTRNVIQTFISPNYYDIVFKSEEFGEVEVSSMLDIKLRDIITENFDSQIIEYDYFMLY